HLMELPGKMTYDAHLYVLLDRTLYPTFGQTAGSAEGFAILSVAGLALRVWERGDAFPLTVTADICQGSGNAVIHLCVQPVNSTMTRWTVDSIPSDWTEWRDQWEYGHAGRALLQTVALAALVLSVLWETPPDTQRQSEEPS